MVEIERLPDATLITVRCSLEALDRVGAPAGLTFPRQANRFTSNGPTRVIWTGPDDWMIVDERIQGANLLTAIEDALAGEHAAVVDVSGNRVRLSIAGPDARALMARACALDLDPPYFVKGHCAGTIVARAQAFVLQTHDAPAYELYVRRSFATYLTDWLITAARALPPSSAALRFPESSTTLPHLP